MQLTDRDRLIIAHVARHRFVRSGHITALVGGSRQAVLRRLQLLYHHGFLERPRAQIEYFQPGGSRSIVYGLANRALELLPAAENRSRRGTEWSAKNSAVKRLFLEHALMISDVMVKLELACCQHRGVRFLHANELPLPAETRVLREPFRWSVTLRDGTRLGVIPDCTFGLEFAERPVGQNRAYFFLEADRGTMPVERESLRQTSFFRKLIAYEATWTQNLHGTRFGFHRFRVLTVTTNSDRVEHLVSAAQQLKRGRGLFVFTELNSIVKRTEPISLLTVDDN